MNTKKLSLDQTTLGRVFDWSESLAQNLKSQNFSTESQSILGDQAILIYPSDFYTEVTTEGLRKEGKILRLECSPNEKLSMALPRNIWIRVVPGAQINVQEEISMEPYEIPSTDLFCMYKCRNNSTKRTRVVLQCNFPKCQFVFRKWHNLLDHLRMHLNQRPYRCKIKGCARSFTQKSNLVKHDQIIHAI